MDGTNDFQKLQARENNFKMLQIYQKFWNKLTY